ncbi:MAG TPA: hypothetical protein P5526_16420 [Anaerolineae bacterium]|nr:hypothetical protein [Anaerolineae bacterium]
MNLMLLVVLSLICLLTLIPHRAYAQWPPFRFNLDPSFEANRITYHIRLSSQVDWALTDVIIKVRPPAGTRFLEASALPITKVDFDGADVTFFTANFNQRSIKDAYFVVEVIDPTVSQFSTHAWISWKGDQAGEYVTDDVSFDISKQPLNWEKPHSRLQLEATAVVSDDVITYALYPVNTGRERMWDLKINVPLPTGTTFISANAPAPFVTNFDGQEVSFSKIELERAVETQPLTFKISTEGVITSPIVTHAWSTWKNGGRRLGQNVLAQEDYRTGDIFVQPHITQQVVSDAVGDVPFSNYDLTSIALQKDQQGFKVIFFIAGELGPVGEPLEYIFYIDHDCRFDTGLERHNLGVDYRLRYRHDRGQADIFFWNELENGWRKLPFEVNSVISQNTVALWLPDNLFENDQQFCWMGEAKNSTEEFTTNLPIDTVP